MEWTDSQWAKYYTFQSVWCARKPVQVPSMSHDGNENIENTEMWCCGKSAKARHTFHTRKIRNHAKHILLNRSHDEKKKLK